MEKANKTQLAKRYGLDYSSIYRWSQEPDFPMGELTHPDSKVFIYPVSEVDRWAVKNCGMRVTRNRIRKLIRQASIKPVIEVAPVEVVEDNKAVFMPTATSTTLEVIVHLLERSPEKQRLVLELLLD